MNTNIKIIAETGFTHEGSREYLYKQIDLAVQESCDYVKFQVLLDIDDAYLSETAIYHDIKTKLFEWKEWTKIFEYAKSKNIKIITLPIDNSALEKILSLGNIISAIEIHSICLNEIPFLDKINNLFSSNHIILGVGGRSFADVSFVINYLKNKNIILMYGFQNFPTHKTDNNLLKINSFKKKFPFPVGFADHTPWNENDTDIIFASLTLGCEYIEKHIILEAGSKRADFYSAVDSRGFKNLHFNISHFQSVMGLSDLNALTEKELTYKNREKKIIAARDIRQNEIISESLLKYKVVNSLSDIEQKEFCSLIGKKLKLSISKDTVITKKMIA